MTKCIQCNEPADIHINWLAKKSETENIPQQCNVCNSCMSILWNQSKNTQFGQTLIISNIND